MRYTKLFLFTLSLLVSSSSAFACGGDTAINITPKLRIENAGGLSQDSVTDGTNKEHAGMFGVYDLRKLVKNDSTALELANKSLTMNTYAHLTYWLLTIPSAGFTGYGLANGVRTGDWTVGIVSAVAFVGSSLLTGHFASEAKHYMYRAINTHNGVLQVPASNKAAEMTNLPSNAQSIAFSFNF